MALTETEWQDEPRGVAYRWDVDFAWDQGKKWDGTETVWTDEEDD